MSDDDLVAAIRQLLTDSSFHGEGYRKLWARLRFKGIRTSRRRVLRLMRAHGLLAPQRAGQPRGPKGPRRHDHHRAGRSDVGHRPDLGDDRRRPSSPAASLGELRSRSRCSHRCRSLLGRVRRHSRQPQRRSLRGTRADRAGRCVSALARSPRTSPRPPAAPRPRQPIREPPLSERDPLPRHRKLTGLRAGA